jgi:hypothetical protein
MILTIQILDASGLDTSKNTACCGKFEVEQLTSWEEFKKRAANARKEGAFNSKSFYFNELMVKLPPVCNFIHAFRHVHFNVIVDSADLLISFDVQPN